MSFSDLPKSIKEEIWSYLDEKELFKLRKVCKEWKKEVENAKSKELRERYERSKKRSEEYLYNSHFYRGFRFTSEIMNLNEERVGIKCCFGKIFPFTQIAANCLCMCCIMVYMNSLSGRFKGRMVTGYCFVSILLHIIFFPIAILLMLVGMMGEFLKLLLWMITLCHCFKSRKFYVRNVPSPRYGPISQEIHPPYLPIDEFWKRSQSFKTLHLRQVKERLRCDACCAIFLCGYNTQLFCLYECCQIYPTAILGNGKVGN